MINIATNIAGLKMWVRIRKIKKAKKMQLLIAIHHKLNYEAFIWTCDRHCKITGKTRNDFREVICSLERKKNLSSTIIENNRKIWYK